jgi:hypothetical protein
MGNNSYLAQAKKARIKGTGDSNLDQQALPINPVESVTLKVRPMVIRNEVIHLYALEYFPNTQVGHHLQAVSGRDCVKSKCPE